MPSTASRFSINSLADSKAGERVLVFGVRGIGKTTLAAMAPSPVFLDLDEGARRAPGARGVSGIESWADMRDALHDEQLWTGCKTIIIDSATAANDLAVAHIVKTVKTEKGHAVENIEGYGYGKGYGHVYGAFMLLLADLDAHVRRGRHVILVCHETTVETVNPGGEDYSRHVPDLLQTGKTGRIRDRAGSWVDHMLFVDYDIIVDKDGKAKGTGTRCIYPTERPSFWAKSRKLADPIVYTKGSPELWNQLLRKE